MRAQVASLEEKVMLLLQRLECKAINKDSHNSHAPPSQDKGKQSRVSKSLRSKSQRKSGGQAGRQGHTLKTVAIADEVQELRSDYCQGCGSALPEGQSIVSRRQVVDIPPVQPVYTEYRQYGCRCPSCDHFQRAHYPAGVNTPIQYGPRIEAYTAYLNVYQYVPYQRLALLFRDVFGLALSQGSLCNMLERAALKARPVYETIQAQIQKASYVGSDETDARVNGKNWWIWTWQNIKNTFLKASVSRGHRVVKQKVSGQFKTGQNAFCILRSVIDTLKKRDLDVFTYLSQIMASPAT